MQRTESIEQKKQANISQPPTAATGPASQVQYPLGGTLSIQNNTGHSGELLQSQYQPRTDSTHVPSMSRSHPVAYHVRSDTRAADPTPGQIPTRTDIQSDDIIPTLDTLRRTPSISDTVFIYLLFYVAFNSRALASNYQHEAPSLRFEPAASEVGGMNSNR